MNKWIKAFLETVGLIGLAVLFFLLSATTYIYLGGFELSYNADTRLGYALGMLFAVSLIASGRIIVFLTKDNSKVNK